MEAPITIREWRPEDADAVWSLHEQALQAIGADIGDGPWDDDLKDVPSVYLDGAGTFVIAERSTALVGMGALRRYDATAGEIKRMRVHPEAQGQGIGRAILNHLLDVAPEFGYARLVLDVTEAQVPAMRLYESAGFRRYGTTVIAANEVLLYEKTLD